MPDLESMGRTIDTFQLDLDQVKCEECNKVLSANEVHITRFRLENLPITAYVSCEEHCQGPSLILEPYRPEGQFPPGKLLPLCPPLTHKNFKATPLGDITYYC